MAIIDVAGVTIHCRDEGPRDAPAVLFANSLGSDFRIWDGVAASLVARWRVVRYDMRGHGLSGAPAGPYALEDQSRDALGLLDRLGIGRFAMVGLSVGGLVAQSVALAAPDRVSSLVLLDTGAKIGEASGWQARIDAVREGGVGAIAERVVAGWMSPAFRASRPAETAEWRAMLERSPVEGYLATCAMLRDADLRARIGAIRARTLCLAGSLDPTTPPALARETAAAIPGARAAEIEGCAHLPCLERPDVVARLVDAHLAGGADVR